MQDFLFFFLQRMEYFFIAVLLCLPVYLNTSPTTTSIYSKTAERVDFGLIIDTFHQHSTDVQRLRLRALSVAPNLLLIAYFSLLLLDHYHCVRELTTVQPAQYES